MCLVSYVMISRLCVRRVWNLLSCRLDLCQSQAPGFHGPYNLRRMHGKLISSSSLSLFPLHLTSTPILWVHQNLNILLSLPAIISKIRLKMCGRNSYVLLLQLMQKIEQKIRGIGLSECGCLVLILKVFLY